MKIDTLLRAGLIASLMISLSACGGRNGKTFKERAAEQDNPATAVQARRARGGTIWDLFQNRDDPNVTVEVNKYLWQASLEVLNFMPIEAADPFSGVIVMGYGTAPGSSRAYRATVYVQDPALDARSLKLALASRSGPASPQTVRALEDAIMTRARQLRVRDSRL